MTACAHEVDGAPCSCSLEGDRGLPATGLHVPGRAYPCTPVPRHPCTWAQIWDSAVGDHCQKRQRRGKTSRTNAAVNNSTALRHDTAKSTTTTTRTLCYALHCNHCCRTKLSRNRLELHYWPSSTQLPAAHRAHKSNFHPHHDNLSPCRPSCHGHLSRLSTAHLVIRGHA